MTQQPNDPSAPQPAQFGVVPDYLHVPPPAAPPVTPQTPPRGIPPHIITACKAMMTARAKKSLTFGAFGAIFWASTFRGARGRDMRTGLMILIALGALPIANGIYGLWKLRSYGPADAAKDIARAQYGTWLHGRKIPMTLFTEACIVLVTLVQMAVGLDHSIEAAGLMKPQVWHGQFWRLGTSTLMHGGVLHILFNGMALLGLGRLLEVMTDWSYLVLTFVVTALAGSVFSLLLMPNTISVGASGGLMGLIGFLAVLGYRRRQFLPPGFLKSVLFNIALIAAMGVAAYDSIDNAAHLGGLVAGLVCGAVLVPGAGALPLAAPGWVRRAGAGSAALLVATAALAIWKIVR